jgi:hypothetical protein
MVEQAFNIGTSIAHEKDGNLLRRHERLLAPLFTACDPPFAKSFKARLPEPSGADAPTLASFAAGCDFQAVWAWTRTAGSPHAHRRTALHIEIII